MMRCPFSVLQQWYIFGAIWATVAILFPVQHILFLLKEDICSAINHFYYYFKIRPWNVSACWHQLVSFFGKVIQLLNLSLPDDLPEGYSKHPQDRGKSVLDDLLHTDASNSVHQWLAWCNTGTSRHAVASKWQDHPSRQVGSPQNFPQSQQMEQKCRTETSLLVCFLWITKLPCAPVALVKKGKNKLVPMSEL